MHLRFYSATLWVARSLLSPRVHLSICLSLSVTFVYCIQTAEDIVKHLSRPGRLVAPSF